jgi:hypothetical protein
VNIRHVWTSSEMDFNPLKTKFPLHNT